MAINLANNNSLANITALPSSITGGAMTLLATQTASGSANLSFTSGIDDTYDSYVFKFYDIHPSADDKLFMVNFSTDGGSNYNVTKTTTFFEVQHDEADSSTAFQYNTGADLAQSTGNMRLMFSLGTDNDQSCAGSMQLFNPSSSVFVKHFISTCTVYHNADYASQAYVAGYNNTTSPINGVRFEMNSGNIDSGVIKLYGIS